MEIINLLEEYISEKRNERRENRFFDPKVIGITTLLYCPIKYEMRQKHPEISESFGSLSIDDGYLFEDFFEDFLLAKCKNKTVLRDHHLEFTIKNFTLSGHPDFVVLDDMNVTIFELKNIEVTYVDELPEKDIFFDENNQLNIMPSYIKQIQIQRFLAEMNYPDKFITSFLVGKTLFLNKKTGKKRKGIFIREIYQTISRAELENIIERFNKKEGPVYNWECNYCQFSAVCDRFKQA